MYWDLSKGIGTCEQSVLYVKNIVVSIGDLITRVRRRLTEDIDLLNDTLKWEWGENCQKYTSMQVGTPHVLKNLNSFLKSLVIRQKLLGALEQTSLLYHNTILSKEYFIN